jgi:signal transduction histidine kinase/CheY-like chemotaxis protein
MRPLSPDSARESILRFDLNVQRRHFFVYTAVAITSGLGAAIGVYPIRVGLAVAVWLGACASSAIYYQLYRRGADRRMLNPLWMATDVVFITLGVYATGGIGSPWFIWYIATAAAASFVGGTATVISVSTANTIAYLAILYAMGQVHFFDRNFGIAFARMFFLFGASFFFLAGISNLQEKRLRIRQLEAEESRQISELTRLTQELADANRRIQEADRLKSQFLANMSHELRTPMNSIIGFAEILADRLDGKIDAKHAGFLQHILASGQHLLSIINDILDLSKIEAGKMEIYPELFRVRPVVDSVCVLMRGMINERGVPNFAVEVPDDLPPIEADLAKFKQVLFNLLSNAVKFSPPNSLVTISARHVGASVEEGTITVSVRDEGIGIDPKDHEVIFQEFRQVDGTAKRDFGGTGLGLALVRKFVELQGGWVTIDSAPGKGSTFSFTLPVRSRAAVVSRAPEVEETASVGERVLVVEDDAHAFDLIASALGSAGYLSIRARHGDEALELARKSRPVAVTLDLVLPGLDGWEVLKRLKGDSSTREIPVVIISIVDNRELGVALGADDYFVKPVDRERLIARIRQLTQNTPPRLLLIDDDHDVHALLEAELARLGFTIESAFDGESGVATARATNPDVIILDLMMPGMSGFEVAGVLKETPETANIPIVVLTSKEISPDDRRELQSKVTSFVQKGRTAREQLVREIKRLRRASA